MSLVRTTLSSACAESDGKIVVASATGIAAGYKIRLDEETLQVAKAYVAGSTTVPVLRGQEGTTATAHPSGAGVVVGAAADFQQTEAPQTAAPYLIAGRPREILSYSADGAIALPKAGADMVAVINGTVAITGLTVAAPTKDLDGSVLTIVSNGKAAHVVTFATALGDGGSNLDVATFAAGGQQSIQLMAMNSVWVPLSVFAGTLTNVTVTMS